MTNEAIGQRIRLRRRELGLTQAQLGGLLTRKRSYAAISDLERGKTAISVEDMIDVSRLLDRPVMYFVFGDEDLPVQPRSIEDFKAFARATARARTG